jgi:uncharacterized protein (TIGR02246 family)
MKRIFLIAAMLIAVSGLVFGQKSNNQANQKGNDEQALRQVIDQITTAVSRNDAAALDRIYADDFTQVTLKGAIQTKAQRLATVRAGDLKYETFSRDEVVIRIYGKTAVVTSRITRKGQDKGQAVNDQLRSTSTWVKTNGRWQLVAIHATPIAGQ